MDAYTEIMTATAANILEEFKRLDPAEQRLVLNELAGIVVPSDYEPLTDDELTAVADETFVLLDKEEEANAQAW